jgi:TolB-like protein/DNA-binding winged helix-turn-helix (wHTH) protein/lipoprotein NlpI
MPSENLRYRFGPYEMRARTRELYKQGTKLRLRPQPYQVLKVLVERAGDVVSREELHDLLWPAETFVDFEQGLNTSIKVLRAVLSDSASEPRYIETLPKLGYRIIVPVEAEAEEPTPSNEVSVSGQPTAVESLLSDKTPDDRVPPQPWSLRRWPVFVGISAVVLIAAALVGYFQWSRSRPRPELSSGRLMLAVLPFENLTGDPSEDYFSDGLTEEMIAQLGHPDPEHLGVIARTSVMRYQHNPEPLDQIARELGVEYVLEGSVRRDSDKVRISAQLIQVKDQSHVWARQYDRELSNLLSLQTEIASEVSNEIQLSLGEREPGSAASAAATRPAPPVPPKNYEAYDDYLKGRYFWNKRTAQGFRQAVDCFEQSVAKDPDYAPAHAGLADSYALMAEYEVAPASELIPKARAAALQALSLDEKLAEAHVSLAVIAQNYDWDWQTSESEFRRAIALDPNYATGHHWYAEHLALLGHFDEAFPEMQRALQLDPLSLIMKADNGVFLYFARQYDRSIEQLRAVLEMEPNSTRGHMIIFPYIQTGRFQEALGYLQHWGGGGKNYWITVLQAELYASANQPAQARHAMEELNQANRRHLIDPYAFVGAYIALGDKDRAFQYLNESVANHSPELTALKVDPIFDPIRSDSRFTVLLDRVRLAH